MKVSCIIPVYNEADRVSRVLDVVVGHELVGEVIVIDDGSADNSKAILANHSGIRLISYAPNKGKSFAIMSGIKEAKNDIIMLVDSDLVGLHNANITSLISPVVENRADIAISLRKNSLLIYKILGLDFVSGERVFHKNIIEDIGALARLPGYGLEVFLNRIIIKKRLRLKVVWWGGVISPRKSKKIRWWQGVMGDWDMIMQILSMLTVSDILYQMYKMRTLRVR